MFTVNLPCGLEEYAAVIRSIRQGRMPAHIAKDYFEERDMRRHYYWIEGSYTYMWQYRRWLWFDLYYLSKELKDEHLLAMIYARIEYNGNCKCNQLSKQYVHVDPKSTIDNPIWCVLLPYYRVGRNGSSDGI